MFAYFKHYDFWMIGSAYGLLAIGALALLGLSLTSGDRGNFLHQLLWIVVGSIFLIATSGFDYRIFRNNSIPVLLVYGAGLLLLVAVFFWGRIANGAQGWIVVGPLTIAPVEFVKLSIVILLAKYFALRHVEMYRFRHILASGLYVAIPSLLVLAQPEIGSFLILASIWVAMMFAAGIKVKHIAFLLTGAVSTIFFAWYTVLHDYQKQRILTFLHPHNDIYGHGYQALQSIIAVASSGMWGKGIGQGTQTQFGFLPEAQTDFIFAAIGEQFGLIGMLVVLTLFGILLWRIFILARRAPNNFIRLSAIGFAMMIFSQTCISIAMNIGLMPITGIPLPFVSYGGSSILSLLIALGLLQSMWRESFYP